MIFFYSTSNLIMNHNKPLFFAKNPSSLVLGMLSFCIAMFNPASQAFAQSSFCQASDCTGAPLSQVFNVCADGPDPYY
ncbi:MAG: hypothetical protein AAB316_03605, partial [Bacteroidota bacterium]